MLLSTEVPTNAPLMSVGLDSLAAVEFANAVSEELGASVSAITLFDHPTLDSIAGYLAAELDAARDSRAASAVVEGDARGVAESAPADRRVAPCIVAARLQVAGPTSSESALRQLVARTHATPSSIPAARWVAQASGAAASAAYGSFLDTEGLSVDGGAFGISALEARSMDPQQSFVLHAGYAALVCEVVDAGKRRDSLVYSSVGVFVGVEPSGLVVRESANVFSASGGAASITSGRFSYALGLVGPCYTIDTACSSALAALHVCATALLRAECDGSVSAGTKVLSEAANYGTSVAGMTSLLGRCHTFDGRADGYCRGEGCGAFYVREDRNGNGSVGCVAANACILGSAVQQDGPSASLTAPNGSSQQRLLETVRGNDKARGDPALEAHGTGTALGDPIEVWLLWKCGNRRCDSECSIKENKMSTGGCRNGVAV